MANTPVLLFVDAPQARDVVVCNHEFAPKRRLILDPAGHAVGQGHREILRLRVDEDGREVGALMRTQRQVVGGGALECLYGLLGGLVCKRVVVASRRFEQAEIVPAPRLDQKGGTGSRGKSDVHVIGLG
ncbi:MAG: hypothetical protein C3F11_09405 [Methylocystaceae bacterium]|nr:MAG: hypothetical protein C3F11_09405 [Methylocystaceae bacterium]